MRVDERLLLIVVAVVVGALSGFASVVLNWLLHVLGELAREIRGHPGGFLLPAAGAAASCVFMLHIVKEGSGHGVPEVIYTIFRHGGLLRLRSCFSRLISSSLTIASGGSAGPEAPAVVSGAAIGSNIARVMGLKDRQRIALVGCGAAGAISSIFNAPVSGIVFAVEVILGEWTHINLIPIAIASVIGTEVSRLLQGNQIPFEHHAFNPSLLDMTACIFLGVLTGLGAALMTRTLEEVEKTSHKFFHRPWLRAAVGGACVGALGLVFPDVLGEGYEVIRTVISNSYAPGLVLVALAALAKILATALTLGTGGSGGIFAPSLVIGALGGLAFQRGLVWAWPGVGWAEEGFYAMLGMAGILSGTLQAPLTGIFLIVEVTGGYEVVLPLILVAVVAATISSYLEPVSFYHRELARTGQLLRPRTDARVLAELEIVELMDESYQVLYEDMPIKEVVDILQHTSATVVPVVRREDGKFVGLVRVEEVMPYLLNPDLHPALIVGELADRHLPEVSPFDEVRQVLEVMDTTGHWVLPVVHNGRLLGLISKAAILEQYRRELILQTEAEV